MKEGSMKVMIERGITMMIFSLEKKRKGIKGDKTLEEIITSMKRGHSVDNIQEEMKGCTKVGKKSMKGQQV
jgi:hypothetical protein